MADRGRDRESIRNVGDTSSRGGTRPAKPAASGQPQPGDAGKTSGGGSSGHDQPADVARETHLRNNAGHSGPTGGQRETPGQVPELKE